MKQTEELTAFTSRKKMLGMAMTHVCSRSCAHCKVCFLKHQSVFFFCMSLPRSSEQQCEIDLLFSFAYTVARTTIKI